MGSSDRPELPVTLLAGSLGSGKTTLLNHILSQNHGRRIAVIENEFGEIPVDHDLIIGADDDLFEMSNGCVCCSIRTDLIETLNRLLGRQQNFDAIVIEATGLASPGPIAQAFLVEDELDHVLRLDGVVTVVDAVHLEKQLEELEVTWEQIAFSNVILLNKSDQVTPEQLQATERRVSSINPTAPIHKTRHAQIELDHILGLGGFELQAPEQMLKNFGQDPEHQAHDSNVMSVSLQVEGKIDEDRFRSWLQMLLITEGMDVFRAKGILNVPDEDGRVIFQSVYMMYESRAGGPWGDEPETNRLVFIGRHLDRDRLQKGVDACLVD